MLIPLNSPLGQWTEVAIHRPRMVAGMPNVLRPCCNAITTDPVAPRRGVALWIGREGVPRGRPDYPIHRQAPLCQVINRLLCGRVKGPRDVRWD